jgi:long-chain acyl-CoA synthetase
MNKSYPFYKHEKISTIRELVDFSADKYADSTAFIYPKNKKEDISVSYIQLEEELIAFGTYLINKGYKNCKIAVFGENSYEWILTHFAVTCSGNVIVPIDKDLNSEEIDYILKDSECSLMVYSTLYQDIVDKLTVKIETINMELIHKIVVASEELISNGDKKYYDIIISPDTLASIVYTSGTTGVPKGVMLTHENFATDTYGACNNVLLTGGTILVLPLHHTFGLVASVFAEIFYGKPVYINRSLKNLLSDFQKIKPQHLFAVPLIVETLYKNIWSVAKKQGKDDTLKKAISISNKLLKVGIDVRKIIFKSVLSAFGGNLDLIVSGGAPIENKYIDDFKAFGIDVLNGYGITECGPVVAVNRNKQIIKGSVGIPLPCNEVKINDDSEILVKGTNVMVGYYNNEKANSEAFENGWFKTGDIGFVDDIGALHIVGRKKNLIILSNGENISAEEIESMVYSIPYVKEAIAYGKDDMITIEVYLDNDYDGEININQDVILLNQNLPLNKNIANIIVRDVEFPKTTTKKIKRNIVEV